jgi:hypothetical protein
MSGEAVLWGRDVESTMEGAAADERLGAGVDPGGLTAEHPANRSISVDTPTKWRIRSLDSDTRRHTAAISRARAAVGAEQ